ncbi:MAG: FAD:protein FMN transferase [Bacillota bacterium]
MFARKPPEVSSRIDICMNTAVSQTVYGVDSRGAAAAASREIQRLERLLSRFRPDSDIGRLNRSATRPAAESDNLLPADLSLTEAGGSNTKSAVSIHRETACVLEAALGISRMSGGAFDVTAAPLIALWRVTADNPEVPSPEVVAKARELVDFRCLELARSTPLPLRRSAFVARLTKQGQMVDLGGIAKGYAADRAVDVYRRRGIASAMIDLGGNVALLGGKEDGSPWRVGIQDPDAPRGDCLGFLSLRDKSVVTSGDYERFFEAGGRRYHHIIDPRTGYPAESGLRSVTVVADESMIADGLSTALFVLGLERGMEMLENLRRPQVQQTPPKQQAPDSAGSAVPFGGVEAIFVTVDRQVYITPGLASAYTPLS